MTNDEKEVELTEEQLTKLARTLKEEKRSHKNKLNQKENQNFAKLEEMPIIKKKGFLNKLGVPGAKGEIKYAKRTNYKEQLFMELEKDEPDLEKVKEYAEKIKKGEIEEYRPLKTPILQMIRSDGSKEWFEGVKSGTLEITRSDEKTAYIDLRKDKILTDTIRNYDDTTVQGWVVYENDQNPLPGNNYMDSHAYFSNLEEIMANKKDVQTERLKQWGNIMWTAGFVFIGILLVLFLVVPWATGKDVFTMLNEAGQKNTGNNNNQLNNYGLTPEEIQMINEIRAQRAMNQTDKNSGGGK